MLAPSTTGVKRCSTRTDLERSSREHAPRGTGTHMACGQSLSACAVGMAERTPNLRVSYEAEQTTPRLSREPPTIRSGAFPAPSGSNAARDRDVECVGVGEENTAGSSGRG